jgi:hypothetical protein
LAGVDVADPLRTGKAKKGPKTMSLKKLTGVESSDEEEEEEWDEDD